MQVWLGYAKQWCTNCQVCAIQVMKSVWRRQLNRGAKPFQCTKPFRMFGQHLVPRDCTVTCLPSLKTRGYVDSDIWQVLQASRLWLHQMSYRLQALSKPSPAGYQTEWIYTYCKYARMQCKLLQAALYCSAKVSATPGRKPSQPADRVNGKSSAGPIASLTCRLPKQ